MNPPRWWALAFVVSGLIWALIIACVWLALPKVGGFSPDLPPKEYRGDARMQVHFTDHAQSLCSIVKAKAGSIACAGVGSDWAIMPNPCAWRDPYARMMCHELGHANGWNADHPR